VETTKPTPTPPAPTAFVDSSAIVALVDRHDAAHEAAVAAYRDLLDSGYRLFTTNFVVAETVDLLTDVIGADVARQWLRDHRLTVYYADEQDERRARALVIGSHSEQGLSYVDAVSLVVMERLGVADAFAVDPNFLSETA
jgi:predicted nucleic acid-binding protein